MGVVSQKNDSSQKLLTLRCERMSFGPDAIGKAQEGKTVFVRGGLPNETVLAAVESEKSTYAKAHAVDIIEASPDRTEPLCSKAELQGSCPWAPLAYPAQLAQKEQNIKDVLVRIGHMDPAHAEAITQSIIPSNKTWHYRNKLELEADLTKQGLKLGVYAYDSDVFLELQSSALLSCDKTDLIAALSGALSFVCKRTQARIDRVCIRSSERTGSLEIALWSPPSAFPRSQAAKIIRDACKASSVVRVVYKGSLKARRVVSVERLYEDGYFSEKIAGRSMKISAPSFFQVNTPMAEVLINTVCALAGSVPHAHVLDLYCGAGTFTLPLSGLAMSVCALESYGPAVRDLRRNIKDSHASNVTVIGGDAGREFPDGAFDLILVDPPRSGLTTEVVGKLVSSRSKSIIYVSCDPTTLARDISRLEASDTYRAQTIIPVDLFPQTFHVETVVLLSRTVG